MQQGMSTGRDQVWKRNRGWSRSGTAMMPQQRCDMCLAAHPFASCSLTVILAKPDLMLMQMSMSKALYAVILSITVIKSS